MAVGSLFSPYSTSSSKNAEDSETPTGIIPDIGIKELLTVAAEPQQDDASVEDPTGLNTAKSPNPPH